MLDALEEEGCRLSVVVLKVGGLEGTGKLAVFLDLPAHVIL